MRVGRVEAVEHFVGNLRVARLVGAHEAESGATQQRRLSVKNEEDGKDDKNGGLADGGPGGQSFARAFR